MPRSLPAIRKHAAVNGLRPAAGPVGAADAPKGRQPKSAEGRPLRPERSTSDEVMRLGLRRSKTRLCSSNDERSTKGCAQADWGRAGDGRFGAALDSHTTHRTTPTPPHGADKQPCRRPVRRLSSLCGSRRGARPCLVLHHDPRARERERPASPRTVATPPPQKQRTSCIASSGISSSHARPSRIDATTKPQALKVSTTSSATLLSSPSWPTVSAHRGGLYLINLRAPLRFVQHRRVVAKPCARPVREHAANAVVNP